MCVLWVAEIKFNMYVCMYVFWPDQVSEELQLSSLESVDR